MSLLTAFDHRIVGSTAGSKTSEDTVLYSKTNQVLNNYV